MQNEEEENEWSSYLLEEDFEECCLCKVEKTHSVSEHQIAHREGKERRQEREEALHREARRVYDNP